MQGSHVDDSENGRSCDVRPPLRNRLAVWLLPVVLFVTSTLMLGGDLGKFGDDYDLHGVDPVTGRIDWGLIANPQRGFARPLHWRVTMTLNSVFWEHDRALHIIGACLHGLTGLLLWRLLRRLCADPIPAHLAAVLFLVYPVGMNAVFWSSANCAVWGTACALAMLLCVANAAQRGSRAPWLAAAAVLAFLTPCWYEQPAPWAAAAGLVFLAAAPRAMPIGRRLRLATISSAVCCLSTGLYLPLAMLTVRDDDRLKSSHAGMGDLWARLVETFTRAGELATPTQPLLHGGFIEGWRRLGELPMFLVGAWVALVAIAAGLWVTRIASAPHAARLFPPPRRIEEPEAHADPFAASCEIDGEKPAYRSRPALLVLLGASMIVLSLLPVAAVRDYNVAERMLYAPTAGAAVALAGLLAALNAVASAMGRCSAGRLVPCRCVSHTLPAVLVLVAAVPFAIADLGQQSSQQLRGRTDRDIAAQLVRLVPDPPKNAVFLPLRNDFWPMRTGVRVFDDRDRRTFVEQAQWTFIYIRHVYRRADLGGICLRQWLPTRPFRGITAAGLRYWGRQHTNLILPVSADVPAPAAVRGYYGLIYRCSPIEREDAVPIPWSQIVPFIIDADGAVRLVDRLRVLRPDNRDFDIEMPVMRIVDHAARSAAVVCTIPDADPDLPALDGWRVPGLRSPARFGVRELWGQRHAAAPLHAGRAGAKTDRSMRVRVPASMLPCRVHFRAAMPEWAIVSPLAHAALTDPRAAEPVYRGDGVVITASLGGGGPLGELTLTPQTDPAQRGWVAWSFDIPASEGGKDRVLKITVGPGENGNTWYDTVFITPGFVETRAEKPQP